MRDWDGYSNKSNQQIQHSIWFLQLDQTQEYTVSGKVVKVSRLGRLCFFKQPCAILREYHIERRTLFLRRIGQNPLHSVFLEAAQQAGHPFTEDVNGFQQVRQSMWMIN